MGTRPTASLVAMVLAVGCAAGDGASPTEGHAPVKVRFTNVGRQPLYVDTTFTEGIRWRQGERVFGTVTSASPCENGCDCFSTPPPMPTVRVLAPGDVLESSWGGWFVEVRTCKGPAPGHCRCFVVHRAPKGRYEATVEAATAVTSVTNEPAQEDEGTVTGARPDTTGETCKGQVTFDLGDTPRVIDAELSCRPQP